MSFNTSSHLVSVHNKPIAKHSGPDAFKEILCGIFFISLGKTMKGRFLFVSVGQIFLLKWIRPKNCPSLQKRCSNWSIASMRVKT